MEAPGSLSLGFNINVLPVAVARGIVQRGIMAGKLKGAILYLLIRSLK